MRGTAAAVGGSRFRARKLNTKTALTILRESDVAGDANGSEHETHIGTERSDAITSLPKVESGVESKEEQVRLVLPSFPGVQRHVMKLCVHQLTTSHPSLLTHYPKSAVAQWSRPC